MHVKEVCCLLQVEQSTAEPIAEEVMDEVTTNSDADDKPPATRSAAKKRSLEEACVTEDTTAKCAN